MPTSWSFSARVEAPPDAVFAWMSDYREDDHARPAFKRGAGVKPGDDTPSKRAILSRAGNVLEIEDHWGRSKFPMRITLAPEKREILLEGQHGYRGTWRAVPEGTGTRVESVGELRPTGVMRVFAPLFARSFAKQMNADFNGHVEDLREELAKR